MKFKDYIEMLKLIEDENKKKEFITILLRKSILPNIQHIFFETTDYCNGTCSFCPVGIGMRKSDYNQISEEIFSMILSKFKFFGKQYKHRISLFNNNEPFTDSNIIIRSTIVRNIFPGAIIHLSTNGTLLSDEIICKLKDSDFDYIKINCYHQKEYERLKKYCIPFDGKFNVKYNQCQFFISKRFDEKNVTYTNRGGCMGKNTAIYSSPCILPLFQLSIDMNGNINKCCYDALQKSIFDNILNYDNVDEFMSSKSYENSYLECIFNRINTYPCNECNVNDLDILDQQLF